MKHGSENPPKLATSVNLAVRHTLALHTLSQRSLPEAIIAVCSDTKGLHSTTYSILRPTRFYPKYTMSPSLRTNSLTLVNLLTFPMPTVLSWSPNLATTVKKMKNSIQTTCQN